MNIGIMMPTWVGDACMATPALQAIRESYPRARIVGVMSPVLQQLLSCEPGQSNPWFDEVVSLQKRRKARLRDPQGTVVSRWGLIAALRRQRLDAMLLFTNSWWSAAVARAAGIKHVVGYDRDARGWMLSDPVPVPRKGRAYRPISAVDYYLQLAAWVGCVPSSRSMQLLVQEQDWTQAENLWNRIGFQSALPTVVINNNAAQAVARVWPVEKVVELVTRVAQELGAQVLLHCGPGEREEANRVAAEANWPTIASMGIEDELPLSLSRGVLGRAAVVVSTDSGARHIAVALDRPLVTLFGPTDPAWTQTYNVPELAIKTAHDCRPCYQAQCPLKHHACMHDIEVQRVLDAIQQQLQVAADRPVDLVAA